MTNTYKGEAYEEDLNMYDEAQGPEVHQLDNEALQRPISELDCPTTTTSVTPDTLIREALDTMARQRIGAVIVVEDETVVGIFAERDVLIKGLYDGRNLERPVRDFMTPDPDCLTPYDSIAFALNRMIEGGYRHVPLVTADRKPVGMLAMRDVVRYVISFFPAEVLNLPPHSEYSPPDRSPEGG